MTFEVLASSRTTKAISFSGGLLASSSGSG